MAIIGRQSEVKLLESVWKNKQAEFVAVYGRRRVGKTFLVREFFKQKKANFLEVVGIKDGNQAIQLQNFHQATCRHFDLDETLETPKSWREAFQNLTEQLEAHGKATVIFLDEMPWMAGKRSLFLQNLDHFWNAHWSKIPNLKLVVCGSAASWMLKKIVRAKGGLYNRLTRVVSLKPFTLSESRDYLHSRGLRLNDKQVLDLYMVLGGIPHYLQLLEKGKSAVQNINDLCFSESGLLLEEFGNLFASLFESAHEHEKIIRAMATQPQGIGRDQLLKKMGGNSGGTFKKRIEELEASGFIKTYVPYGKKQSQYFRIIDEYSLFYLQWIEPFKQQSNVSYVTHYWQNKSNDPSWIASAGYLFESVCYKHVAQIQKALGLLQTACEVGTWRYVPKAGIKQKGAQIDLLFDRADGVITICEIKYSNNLYLIDKAYGRNLMNKLAVFEEKLKTDKQLFLAMVTTKGVKKNLYSQELVDQAVTLPDLFIEV